MLIFKLCCLLGRLQINQNLIRSNQIKVWVLITKENQKKKIAPKQETEQPKILVKIGIQTYGVRHFQFVKIIK